MNLDEAARLAADAVRRDAAAATRPGIVAVRRARRGRQGFAVLAAAMLATIAVFGGLAAWGGSPGPDPSATTVQAAGASNTTTEAGTRPSASAPPPSSPSTSTAAANTGPDAPVLSRWTIAGDPAWYRADSDLMPDSEWESVTLATFPISPGGTNCAHLPETALRDLGSGDALISIFFTDALDGDHAGPRPWPSSGFSDEMFPAAVGLTDAHECAGRPELEIHWDAWRSGAQDLYVLAAFGSDVDEATRAAAWATLSSLAPPGAPQGPVCVVTVPRVPGFTPPKPYPALPSIDGMAWYGTPALWVPLPVDGSFVPTKSVWWSEDFDITSGEERPRVSVTHERLDAPAPAVESDGPGTNANTSEDGWFMIANIEILEEPGCWRVTARYRAAELSYVVLVP